MHPAWNVITEHITIRMYEICSKSLRPTFIFPYWKVKATSMEHGHNQSLLEYKAVNVKLGNCACVIDLIHITLWRNDGFLHSFCNFSKSNTFSKNFIRTKFILHKIFFHVYFWAGKPRVCSSIYVKKIVKNHLWEEMTTLREQGVWRQKSI